MPHDMAMPPLHDSGNFIGHVIPGTMLLLWAAFWIVGLWRSRGARAADAPLERDPLLIGVKIVLPLVGVGIEWPGRGWPDHVRVMNFQHVSMYAFFALGGLVDLLNRRGLLPRGATYAAFAAAALNAGVLFLAHGSDGGVSGTVHSLLAATFLATALAGVAEWLRPDLELHWLRVGGLIVLGSWFYDVAWILFRSGLDPREPMNQMRSQLFFSWHVLGAAALLLALRVACVRAERRALATAADGPLAARRSEGLA